MCGISLILTFDTNADIIKILIDSLEQLQNRGYDSFGVAYYNQNEKQFKITKKSNCFRKKWLLASIFSLFQNTSYEAQLKLFSLIVFDLFLWFPISDIWIFSDVHQLQIQLQPQLLVQRHLQIQLQLHPKLQVYVQVQVQVQGKVRVQVQLLEPRCCLIFSGVS